MISSHRPPKRPLGEIAASDHDASLLAASERAEEDAVSLLAECARRLKQARDFAALVAARAEDPAAALYSEEERDRLASDLAKAARETRELEGESSALCEEIEAQHLVQEAAKERLRILAGQDEGSIWMVTTLGVPREVRLGGPTAEAAGGADAEPRAASEDEDDEDEEEDVLGDKIPTDLAETTEGLAPTAMINSPEGVCVGPDGAIYVTDTIHCVVLKVSGAGRVTLLAGTGARGHVDGRAAHAAFADASKAKDAEFRHPRGIVADEAGNLFVCDTENHTVRGISLEGRVSTLAGSGEPGFVDGPALHGASFRLPWACCRGALAAGEALFVADAGNHCIRAVATEGGVGTVRTIYGEPGKHGSAVTQLNFPWSLCFLDGLLYVGDKFNQRLLAVLPDAGAPARALSCVLSDQWVWSARFAPRGLAAGHDGWVYMSHSSGSSVWRFCPVAPVVPVTPVTPVPEGLAPAAAEAGRTQPGTLGRDAGGSPALRLEAPPPEKIAGSGVIQFTVYKSHCDRLPGQV